MPYLGSAPATSFLSMTSQSFTGGSGTSFTLNKAVSTTSDIAVFVNNVRQSPVNSSYSVSGTTLTMSASIASSDNFYVVFLGSAVGTINPASGSVGISQLSATGTKDATTFLRGDNSFVSVGGTNTPAFEVYQTSSQTPADNVYTKLTFTGESFDTDSAWADSKFTVPSGKAGKYVFLLDAGGYDDNNGLDVFRLAIYKNGSAVKTAQLNTNGSSLQTAIICTTAVLDLSVGDYIEGYINANIDSGTFTTLSSATGVQTRFSGFKLIE